MTIEKLKAICVGATPQWRARENGRGTVLREYEIVMPLGGVLFRSTSYGNMEADAKHIATFNPQLVLAMLEIIEASIGMREDGYNDGVIQTYDTKRTALDELIRGMR
jgi:hypothetical protein